MSPGPASLEGWRIACRTLEALGITHAFGLPGTQTVALYEALRTSKLTCITPVSELSAAFMAGAYYRASGRVAVLTTIPGPGFTYALTGLAEARLDSAALIHLTIAAPEGPNARFALQAIPQRVLGDAIAKCTITVERLADIVPALQAAHTIATSGEPGPVVVSFTDHSGTAPLALPDKLATGSDADLAGLSGAWLRLLAARRPVIYAGQGARASSAQLRELAEALGVPVLTTPSARGLLPEDHPLCLPFDPCRGGLDIACGILREADFILVLGAKLGHNGSSGHALPFDPERCLQVEADPAIAGKAYGIPHVTARVEDWFAARPADLEAGVGYPVERLQAVRQGLRSPPGQPVEPRIDGLSPREFFRRLRAVLAPETVLVTDTGLHQVLTRRHFDVLAPGGLLIPSDFQSMGFGLPAAIAAKLAVPNRPVVALVGDGGLMMSVADLATAAKLRLSLAVFVFNDGALNQIRLQQHGEFGAASGTDLAPVDWAFLCESLDVSYAGFDSVEGDLGRAIETCAGPLLVEVQVADSVGTHAVREAARARRVVQQALGRQLVARLKQFRALVR